MRPEEIEPAIERAFPVATGGEDLRRRILKCTKYLEQHQCELSPDDVLGSCAKLKKLAGDSAAFAKEEQKNAYGEILKRLDLLRVAAQIRQANARVLEQALFNGT